MVVFLGVDIAWSMDPKPNSSGVCIMKDKRVIELTNVGSNQEILELAKEFGADYIGIDAPLKVPNKKGSRPVERELARRGRPAYPANRKFFNKHYGGIRGEELVELFEKEGYPFIERTKDKERGIIEVYPNPTIKALLGRIPNYKNVKKKEVREGIAAIWKKTINKRLPVKVDFNGHKGKLRRGNLVKLTAKELKRKGDVLDAFFCAYVMLLDYKDIKSVEVIGNKEEGYILTLIENNKKITEYT